MEKIENTGKYFRYLRKSKKISLHELVKRGLISQGRLSRWENGESELPWPIVEKLLLEIGSNLDEFVYSLEYKQHAPLFQLEGYYSQNDRGSLEKFIKDHLKKWNENRELEDAFYSAFAVNIKAELQNKVKADFSEKSVLLDNLAVNEHWYIRDVGRFENIMLLLSSQEIYERAESLINYFDITFYDGYLWHYAAYEALVKASTLLLKRKEFKLFDRLYQKIKN